MRRDIGCPISALGIVTCDRPESFRRALSSYTANARLHEREITAVVVHDSRSPANSSAVRQAVEGLDGGNGIAGVYLGPEERATFVDALAAALSGVPREIIDFVLTGALTGLGTFGAARNCLFLWTIGAKVLTADDDTVCRVASCAVNAGPPRIHGSAYGPGVRSYPSREEVIRDLAFGDHDLLGIHDRLLGQSLQEAVESCGAAATEVPEACSGARVAITSTGIAGDCGWGSPSNYLFLGDRLAGITESHPYESAVQSREVLQAAASFVFVRRPLRLMLTVAGLDNTQLLPPFPPAGRGEDAVFGTCLAALSPLSIAAYIPYAVIHDAELRRFWPGEVVRSATGFDLSTLISVCVDSASTSITGAAEERCRLLGGHMEKIARMSARQFDELARELLTLEAERWVIHLQTTLARFGPMPERCKKDTLKFIRVLRQTLTRTDMIAPQELLRDRDLAPACAAAQHMLGLFGQTLRYWPDIVHAARELKSGRGGYARTAAG